MKNAALFYDAHKRWVFVNNSDDQVRIFPDSGDYVLYPYYSYSLSYGQINPYQVRLEGDTVHIHKYDRWTFLFRTWWDFISYRYVLILMVAQYLIMGFSIRSL